MSGNGRSEGPASVDVLRARRVELTDDQGTVRAVLSGGAGPGTPCGLMLSDEQARPRLAVHVTTSGNPQVDVLAADGTPRLHLALDADGVPTVALLGQGRDGITLRVPNGGSPTVELIDGAGDARMHLRVDERGAGLVLVAIPGKSQLILATRNNAPALLMTDSEGQPRLSLTVTESDGPDVRVLGEDGVTPAWGSAKAPGES
jgi:hypothetical protein